MNKESFLQNPIYSDDIPLDWRREHYETTISEFEVELQHLIHDISKCGALSLSGKKSFFDEVLTDDEVVAQYCQIRDSCKRLETEWRPKFKLLYPSHVQALPPIIGYQNAPVYYFDLVNAIDQGDPHRFQRAVAALRQMTWKNWDMQVLQDAIGFARDEHHHQMVSELDDLTSNHPNSKFYATDPHYDFRAAYGRILSPVAVTVEEVRQLLDFESEQLIRLIGNSNLFSALRASDKWWPNYHMHNLARALTTDEVLFLFSELKAASVELWWRPQFKKDFAKFTENLPPIEAGLFYEPDIASLANAIDSGSTTDAHLILEDLNVKLKTHQASDLPELADFARQYERDDIARSIILICDQLNIQSSRLTPHVLCGRTWHREGPADVANKRWGEYEFRKWRNAIPLA